MPSDPTEGNPGITGHSPPVPPRRPAPAGAPVLTVVRGNPSAEEIAALVAVLAARTAPARAGAAAARPRPEWSARYRLLREPLARGPARLARQRPAGLAAASAAGCPADDRRPIRRLAGPAKSGSPVP